MNVFVLCTGRCGSAPFSKACGHITNFTSGHETRARFIGPERLAYPDNHIEVDSRLAWFLGRLDAKYADTPFYVHLTRDLEATARSFTKRANRGIMAAYRDALVLGRTPSFTPYEMALDYCETVTENIRVFLKGKVHMEVRLEEAMQSFPIFWERVHASGSLPDALAEFATLHNQSR